MKTNYVITGRVLPFQLLTLISIFSLGLTGAMAQPPTVRGTPFGLNPGQVQQINSAAQAAPDLERLTTQLATAQKEAVVAALDTTTTEAVVHEKVDAVARIQTDIAMLRYRNGIKPVAASVTASQKDDLQQAPDSAYRQLFANPFAIQARGGGFAPR